jgi:hypothetical protein
MKNLLLRMFECSECLLCALAFAALTVGTCWGQSSASGAKVGGMVHEGPALEVTLKTDKNSYKLGDEISIEVVLTNKSKSPVYIYALLDWGESASLSIWLKDVASGKGLSQRLWGSPPSPPPASREEFVRLDPGYVYGEVFREKLADLGVEKKGEYELVAAYHSPIPASMGFGLPIWSSEKGAVLSNRVTITVGD